MSIEINTEKCGDWSKIEIIVNNGVSEFKTFDLLKLEGIKDFENHLRNLAQDLNEYIKKQEASQWKP